MITTTALNIYLFETFAAVLNISFGVFIFFSRARADPGMLTKSQRWGLTLLGSIFILNGMAILTEAAGSGGTGLFHNLVCIGAIAFIFVYPKPITSWNNMGRLLAFLAGFTLLGVLLVPTTGDINLEHLVWTAPTIISFMLLPMYLLWKSRNEISMQNRMVTAIIAWGFLFNVSLNGITNLLHIVLNGKDPNGLFSLTANWMLLLMVAMMLYILWSRRGNWAAPEHFNAAILAMAFVLAIIQFNLASSGARASEQGAFVARWLSSSWVWVRPLLLAFGLLRYHILGTALKMDRMLLWLGWMVMVLFIVIWSEVLLIGSPPELLAGAGFVIALVAAYPAFMVSQRIIRRLLPLTAGQEGTNLVQQRSAYLLSLQTAVVDGKLTDEFDQRALRNLRRTLGISEREHELLMASFPRKKLEPDSPRILELFLILSDGRLVAHAGSLEEEKEIVAGMLTAIRGFARDGLKAGHKELDTVKYGDYTLMMESEGKVLLAALVLGPETPAVRVRLRDCLAEALRTSGDTLRKWDGELEKVEPVRKLMATTLASP